MATWNYLEAGHGKGAPDGVGGLLKRTADRLVSLGSDLPNAVDVYAALTRSQSGVQLFFVPQEDVQTVDSLLSAHLPTIQGTMKIRQVVTTKYGEIKYRQLTCFCNQNKYAACLCHNPSSFVFTENNLLIDVDIGQSG